MLTNNIDILRRAAIDGVGIAAIPEFFVAEDLAEGHLI
jgi:DNA-binding transcriptional LysR family regulator